VATVTRTATAEATLTPTPTARPTLTPATTTVPTPTLPTKPSPSPVHSAFRLFAKQISRAVEEGDAQFFWSHARTNAITCTPEAAGSVYGCKDLPRDATVRVLHVSNPFEGTAYREDQLVGLFTGLLADGSDDVRDAYGPETPRLYSTSITSPTPGQDVYHAVISRLVTHPQLGMYRLVVVTSWDLADGEWQHVRLWTSEHFFTDGSPSGEDWMSGGCTAASPPCREWSSWP
jgi:hypothetical protein